MPKNDLNNDIEYSNKINKIIFTLVKEQKWDDVLELIDKNYENFDYNIKDGSNTWFLEYLIIFNKHLIIEKLLTKHIRIDILDEENRSILYNVIKFSYIDILKILLQQDKKKVGKSILNIIDNEGNTPIYYCVKFCNETALNIMTTYQTYYYGKNKEGENILHYSVKTMNLSIFKILNNFISNINIGTNNNETCFHLAIKYKHHALITYILECFDKNPLYIDFDIKEIKYNFTALHYIFISIDFQMIYIFKDYFKYFNVNALDKSGNTIYHYWINNISMNTYKLVDINKTTNILFDLEIDYDLVNIDGNTALHLFLTGTEKSIEANNLLMVTLIFRTNINIQNNLGESCLFMLIKKNLWKNVANKLVDKKLDIFIMNKKRNTLFDYLDNEDISIFLDLVIKSYLHKIETYENIKWVDYWDNRCKTCISLSDLNETEKELIKEMDVNLNDGTNTLCYNIIKNKISKYIDYFKLNKNNHMINSYPVTIQYPQLIKTYFDVKISTFTGSTLDVYSSLYFMELRHKNIFRSSLKLIKDAPVVCNSVKSEQDNTFICEVTGFEILWKNHQLVFPFSVTELINNLSNIKAENKIRFYGIPIGIEINSTLYSTAGHANFLLFDFKQMEVERFEPHGANNPEGLDYDTNLFDNMLENKIKSFKLQFKYISPMKYLPKIGFQIMEIHELKSDFIGDPNGFCSAWCSWWIDIRMSNPDINRKKLSKLLIKEIINDNYSLKQLIRNYSKYMTDQRDKLLIKIDSDINDWINDKISKKNIQILNNIIISEINAL